MLYKSRRHSLINDERYKLKIELRYNFDDKYLKTSYDVKE